MPWKELCSMTVREEFVLEALDGSSSFSALCARYSISRKTGYKWRERYKKYGLRGLEDLSRRPSSTPLATTAEMVAEVVAARNAHPSWGPRKLREMLKRQGVVGVPGTRTIARILERAGYIQPLRRRPRHRPVGHAPELVVRRPNDVWTVDFKGWWLCGDGRCEPLTVRDAFSRFVLDIRVLTTTRGEAVRRVFEELFSRYGLPRTILTDNGSPFATSFGLGLTRLSVWWLSLGIDVQRTRPGTPSDNGGHERMHRDIKAELQQFAALTLRKQQAACDRWRHDFNHHRPHEALLMKVPADLYQRSAVRFVGRAVAPNYAPNWLRRKASNSGVISVGAKRLFLSETLAQQQLGLEPLGVDRFGVWFHAKYLGVADFRLIPAFTPDTERAPALASRAPAKQTRAKKAAA